MNDLLPGKTQLCTTLVLAIILAGCSIREFVAVMVVNLLDGAVVTESIRQVL